MLAAVRGTIADGAVVLAYGSSMGGYAAIRFADRVGAQRVLALSPQYSVDPRVVPQDRRWRSAQRRIRFRPELNGPIGCAAEVTIVYDPCSLDGHHVERIARDVAVRRVRIRHAGHPVGTFLGEVGQLADTMLSALDGGLDPERLEAICRAARATSMVYVSNLALAQPAWRPRLGLALAERGAALKPALAVGHNFLALRLRALGRHDAAIKAHEAALSAERVPTYLQDYGETLLMAGRFAAAAAVADEIIAVSPTLAAAHNLKVDALAAAARPYEARRSVMAMLRLSPRDISYWRSAGRLVRAGARAVRGAASGS